MRELTMAASGVRALLDFAASRGASRTVLAERSRINPAELADSDHRILFSKYVALMKAAQELCNDPALALHFGDAIDLSEISIPVASAITTIDEAFAQVNRYARLVVEVDGVGSGDRYQLRRAAGRLWVIDARRNANDFPELTESTFARMVSSTRRCFRDTPFFKAVHFTHAEPPYRAEYERIFRVPVVFASDKNALQIDEALLSNYRIPPSSRYASGVLRDHAEALLQKLDSSQSTRGRVEGLLAPVLHNGEATVDAVARKLGLSRYTLFRRLRAEGVTFQQVLDELRHQTALHYLSGEKASVKRTARLVGFSDPTAFARAFKRWTGGSPRTYAAMYAAG
jgi:AraC-like DNA-binding protein